MLALPLPPKYQNWSIKVAPHPKLTVVPAPYSKLISSLNVPSQSMTIGLFATFFVLKTKTAFIGGDVVVSGAVEVVTSGTVVVDPPQW